MKKVRFSVTECTADSDLITLTDWTEEAPTVLISFPGRRSIDPRNVVCYDGRKLGEWLTDEENVFAKWLPNNVTKPMEDNGHGGHPSENAEDLYWKLYTGEYIKVDGLVLNKVDSEDSYIFDAEIVGEMRLGNRQGSFGVSMLHGQAPGVTVYRLKNPRKVDIKANAEIDGLYGYTFDQLFANVPFKTIEKYPAAVLNAARRIYLNEMYLRHAGQIVDYVEGALKSECIPAAIFSNHNVEKSGLEYRTIREQIGVLPGIGENIAQANFTLSGFLDGTWVIQVAYRDERDPEPQFKTRHVKRDEVISFFAYLLQHWVFTYPDIVNPVYPPGITLASTLDLDADLYKAEAPHLSSVKYFTKSSIPSIFGVLPSKNANNFFEEHGKEILDRMLQLYSRKPLQEQPVPGAPKKAKKKDDDKVSYDFPFNRAITARLIDMITRDNYNALEDYFLASEEELDDGELWEDDTVQLYLDRLGHLHNALKKLIHDGTRLDVPMMVRVLNGPIHTTIRTMFSLSRQEDAHDEYTEPIRILLGTIGGPSSPKSLSPKVAKTSSPKVTKSPKRTVNLSEALLLAYENRDERAIVALFPSSADRYLDYLTSLHAVISASEVSPEFSERLFVALNVLRARLVPMANYEEEIRILKEIREMLSRPEPTENVVHPEEEFEQVHDEIADEEDEDNEGDEEEVQDEFEVEDVEDEEFSGTPVEEVEEAFHMMDHGRLVRYVNRFGAGAIGYIENQIRDEFNRHVRQHLPFPYGGAHDFYRALKRYFSYRMSNDIALMLDELINESA